MFIKATKSQTAFLLRQKEAILIFYLLLIMVLINYLSNVLTFQGMDVSQMYQPMKLLLLSYNRVNYNADATLLLVQLYPILVVCPAGFALVREQQSGERVFMIARLGEPVYKFSKLTAAFLATAIVFLVPFLIELVLNCLSFPLEATGDLTNWGAYSPDYIQSVHHYFMSNIYQYNPYLYALSGTLFFAVVSGIFGAFTVAFSSVARIKYRIFLFLPVFVLLHATIYLVGILPSLSTTITWYDYLLFFNDLPKSLVFLCVSILLLIVFSVCAIACSRKKELVQ